MSDPPMQNSPCRLRAADPGEIAEIARINDEAGLARWAETEYRSLLERPGMECVVADEGGRVIGFYLLLQVGPEADLLKIAVTPSRRGTGIGGRLLQHCLDSASRAGVEVCFLEVRRSNQAALSLYHRFRFEECGVRRAYYSDPAEDAVILRCGL